MNLQQLISILFLCMLSYAQDDEPSIPSNMPSPPKINGKQGGNNGGGGRGRDPSSNLFSAIPPVPPPQNSPVGPPVPVEPEIPAPFGLDHIILILVPQFKTTIANLPKWMGSSLKFSLPITVFFDKLKFPPPPPGHISPLPFHGPFFPNGHYVKKRSVVVERSLESDGASKRSSFNESIYQAERIMLIPRLQNFLSSFGVPGKECFLRAVCEIHDFPLQNHGYGLFGELISLFFSISRSGFADTLLLEYLKAEEFGQYGDCSRYIENCSSSLFFWEKVQKDENEVDDEYDKAEAEFMELINQHL